MTVHVKLSVVAWYVKQSSSFVVQTYSYDPQYGATPYIYCQNGDGCDDKPGAVP